MSEKSFKGKRGRKTSEVKKEFDEKKPYKGPNDSSWRTEDDVLTLAAGNFPFGNPIGLPMEAASYESGGTHYTLKHTIPGVMAISVQLTLGSISTGNPLADPANLAMTRLFAKTRQNLSGSIKNYEGADQAMVIGAYGNALGMLGWFQRIYYTTNMYKGENRYLPDALLHAQNIDVTDLRKHQAEFAFLISWMGSALRSLPVVDLPYLHACYEAFGGYYCDDESPKHQTYMLVPRGFFVYDAANGLLDFAPNYEVEPSQNTPLTYNDLFSMAHEAIDVLLTDESVAIICGDFAKAFTNLFALEAFNSDRVAEFTYSLEFLQQLHNLQCGITHVDNIKQVPGTTQTASYLVNTFATVPVPCKGGYKAKIDAYSGVPNPKEVINCLTLQVNNNANDITNVLGDYEIFDLFYVVGIYTVTGVSSAEVITYFSGANGIGQYEASLPLNYATGAYLSAFDWHPLWVVRVGTTSVNLFGDIRNLNWFESQGVFNVHVNSMLKLLGLR